jgi:hypothetical protein
LRFAPSSCIPSLIIKAKEDLPKKGIHQETQENSHIESKQEPDPGATVTYVGSGKEMRIKIKASGSSPYLKPVYALAKGGASGSIFLLLLFYYLYYYCLYIITIYYYYF